MEKVTFESQEDLEKWANQIVNDINLLIDRVIKLEKENENLKAKEKGLGWFDKGKAGKTGK